MVLDMPGADPDSLEVTLDNRVLRIAARSASSAPEGSRCSMPNTATATTSAASGSPSLSIRRVSKPCFKDGVLTLTLPKSAPSPAARISVKAA